MFFTTSGKQIALVFSKWFSFGYCSGGLLAQIQGISISFFQKDLRKLQQITADIPSIPYLMDGLFLVLCSLCHMIIFLITQKPKTDWAVEQNDSWRLVSLSTRQKSSLGQSSIWIKVRDFNHFVQQQQLGFYFFTVSLAVQQHWGMQTSLQIFSVSDVI